MEAIKKRIVKILVFLMTAVLAFSVFFRRGSAFSAASIGGGDVGVAGSLTGDVDGDGDISDWDTILLERYLAGWNVTVDLDASDVDHDGEVSDWDTILLSRRLAGWDISWETPAPEPTPVPLELKLQDPSLTETLDPEVTGSENGCRIVYHANGGTITGIAGESASVFFPLDFFLCPNTLPDTGYFYREGYILAGYTENADGSGKYYGPGWNVIPGDEVLQRAKTEGSFTDYETELYCLWKSVSPAGDFDFTVAGSAVVIGKYNGNDESVVIPERINGLKVAAIETDAFVSKNLREVFIPKYIENVKSAAFRNCQKLETVNLSDSVLSMEDDAFESCGRFKTLKVLAVRNPVYSATLICSCGAIKYENLMTAKGKKLIHVSGSNGLYAIDSPALEAKVGNGFTAVNMSINANCNIVFSLELASTVVNEGDIVVISPENNGYQLGIASFNPTMWQSLEGTYDAVAAVDIRNYGRVFSSFATYNTNRLGAAENNYCSHHTEVNRRGDTTSYLTETKSYYAEKQDKYLTEGGKYSYLEGLSLLKVYGRYINKCVLALGEKGCDTLYSFPATDRCCLAESSGGYPAGQSDLANPAGCADPSVSAEDALAYESFIDGFFKGKRISSAADSIFDRDCFWNAEWHVNGKGRDLRTERLANDILAYFDAKGS